MQFSTFQITMRHRLFLFFWVMVHLTAHAQSDPRGVKIVGAASNGKRTALVIGNASYTNVGVLRNPLNDARTMSQALGKLGFAVTQRTNLDRAGLETAINNWGKTLGQYDVALFYYAGHGMEANGINYLMPTDANPQNQTQVKFQALPVEIVTGWMDEGRTKTNIVLLDACRNNPFTWSRNTTDGGLANMTAPSGTFVGFAASPGKTAADGDRNNGLYTEAIVKHLQTPGLTIDQIFNRVNQYVRQQSGGTQVPFKNSSLEDDFFFAAPDQAEPAPAPAVTRTEPAKPRKQKEPEPAQANTDLDPVPMVFVEGGSFMMGSESGEADEKPVHQVTVSSFRMAKTETTVAQYKQYCEETGIKMPDQPEGVFSGRKDNHPVVNITWEAAQGYCEWLTRKTGLTHRLPTEAEWEYAARGGQLGKGYIYAGSNGTNTIGWTSENAGGSTHPVGEKLPNELGLFDMTGNVWEWCADWYDGNYYASSSSTNPVGPASGPSRVLRGGSWDFTPPYCRVAYRNNNTPSNRSGNVGFRPVSQ